MDTERRRRVELTNFVGRRRELADGRRLLGSTRLLTLVGPGGVGKTRLARQLADDVARAFSDGVFVAELAHLRDPDAVAPELAAALGLEDVTRSPEATVTAFLRERRLLVVLDNCEHLVDACARLVQALLQESPGLSVLATSRQQLGVAGEQLMVVEPLSLPPPADAGDSLCESEAVELFVERARLVVPGFELDPHNAELVARLCTVLDGIPLAIELAAARLRMLSLAQLADRLDDRFGDLGVAATAALPRHQTLRASVDWSFDLCSSEEQTLWARMSVFEGGADLDAVEAVCGGSDLSVFDTVSGLVDKSVLAPQEEAGRVRYRMLDTLRAYGRERLAERGEAGRLVERHRAYFVDFARSAGSSWFGPDQRDLMARTAAENANLRAAFEACLESPDTRHEALSITTSLWWYWVGRGAIDEGIRWTDRALVAQVPGEVTLEAVSRAAHLSALRGDRKSVVTRAEAVLAMSDLEETDVIRSSRRQARTHLLGEAGDLESVLQNDREALHEEAQTARLGPEEVVSVLIRMAVTLAWAGRPDEALERVDEAIRICREHGEEWYLSFLHYLRGARLAELDRPQEGLDAQREALRLARGGFNSYTVANALVVVAQNYATMGHGARAAVVAGASGGIWPGIGSPLEGRIEGVARDEPSYETSARDPSRDEGYAARFERGKRMTLEEIVSFVLDEQEQVPAEPRTSLPGASTELTRRELEVADLVARGLSNREISQALVISPRTAEGHVTRLLDKLGFTSRAGVAAWVADRRAGGHWPVSGPGPSGLHA